MLSKRRLIVDAICNHCRKNRVAGHTAFGFRCQAEQIVACFFRSYSAEVSYAFRLCPRGPTNARTPITVRAAISSITRAGPLAQSGILLLL